MANAEPAADFTTEAALFLALVPLVLLPPALLAELAFVLLPEADLLLPDLAEEEADFPVEPDEALLFLVLPAEVLFEDEVDLVPAEAAFPEEADLLPEAVDLLPPDLAAVDLPVVEEPADFEVEDLAADALLPALPADSVEPDLLAEALLLPLPADLDVLPVLLEEVDLEAAALAFPEADLLPDEADFLLPEALFDAEDLLPEELLFLLPPEVDPVTFSTSSPALSPTALMAFLVTVRAISPAASATASEIFGVDFPF